MKSELSDFMKKTLQIKTIVQLQSVQSKSREPPGLTRELNTFPNRE